MPPATDPKTLGETILARLKERFGAKVIASGSHAGQPYAVVRRDELLAALEFLKTEPSIGLDFLADVTAVDHLFLELPQIGERFAVVYQLASTTHGGGFRLKVPVSEDDPRVSSASRLWRAALWGERECHDMYGIVFDGNPDLRRLLMPADYEGWPLRKDYPLRGRGERDRFPKLRQREGEEPAGAASAADAAAEHDAAPGHP